MIQLDRRMLELVANQLQIGDEAPNYNMKVKRVEESDLDPYEFTGNPKGIISLEVSASRESGCSTATVKVEDTYGLMSPQILGEKKGKLCLKPSQIAIKPGQEAQFYAYISTDYNNILVGGPGVLKPENCTWKIVPIGSTEDYGDVSGLVINNGKITNTTLPGGLHYAECHVTATYRGTTVMGDLTIYDKAYLIDVDNPIFMVRDAEEQDGDWFYFSLNNNPLVFKNQSIANSKGYGIGAEDTNSVISGIQMKSCEALDPVAHGFQPEGTNYSGYPKVWTELPLKLKNGLNKLKITATWNGRRYYDSGKASWHMGDVTGNAQLCYPDAARTPRYTEDGANNTLKMDSIYMAAQKIDMNTGSVYADPAQAGPQSGLYDLAHGSTNPRQTVTWLIEYRDDSMSDDSADPLKDIIIDDPDKYFQFKDDQMLSDYNSSHYENLFIPETYCQLGIGYADIIVPVITGAIDSVEVDSKEATLTFTMRDNIRYLVDQSINALKWGKAISYPKTNITVTGVIDPSHSVNRTKFVTVQGNNSISIRTGPSNSENMIGTLNPGDKCTYLGTTNGWHCIMYGNASGFVDGSLTLITEASAESTGAIPIGSAQIMVKVHQDISTESVYAQPSTTAQHIGTVRSNETYPYLRTVASGTFFNIDYNGMSGYVRTAVTTQTTENSDGYTNTAKYEVIGIPDPFYLKTAPDENSTNTTIRIYNGDTLDILSIDGDWRKVKYPFGDQTPGYVYKDNVKLVYVPQMVSASIAPIQWKATDIIMDLAVEGTTIKCFEAYPLLDRNVCNIIVEDYYVPIDGELSAYTIPSKTFPMSESYFDACMEIVNLLGHVSLRCTRYGDILLRSDHKQTQLDDPNWIITDYADLTSLTFKMDSVDTRNRVIIQSDYGWNMYENPMMTQQVTKGVNRTTCINVGSFGDTESKRRIAASNFFEQLLTRFKTLSIAIKGNPLIEINQIIDVRDLVSGTNDKYCVREYKHTFADEGFITQLELDYISTLAPEDLIMLTDQFPTTRDTFNYRQYMNPYETKKIEFKYGFAISNLKAKIRISKSGAPIADVDIVQDVVAHDETTTTAKKYVYLEGNGVNIRTSANGPIKKVEDYGWFGEYLGTEGDWYKVKDSDGQTVYVWAKFCEIKDGGSSVTSTTSTSGTDSQIDSGVYTYNDLISQYASQFGLSSKLVACVVKKESDFTNPNENSAGAAGVMQLIASTASSMGVSDRMDPDQNIMGGCKYLSQMISEFGGNIQLGLAAYNAGPGSVHTWVNNNGGNGDWNVVRNSAYSETRNYVDTIMGWYGNGSSSSSSTPPETTLPGLDGSVVDNIITLLKSKIGCKYVWSGDGPQIFDCSGLVHFCYNFFEVSVPRTSEEQYSTTLRIAQADLYKGDLCFHISNGDAEHVGVYIGNNQIIEAPQTGELVKIINISSYWNGFGRVAALNGTATYHTSGSSNTTTVVLPSGVNTVVTKIPDHYKITTTYLQSSANQAEIDKTKSLNGNVLCVVDGCVLYNIDVKASGTVSTLDLDWISTNGSPVDLDLTYDVMIY